MKEECIYYDITELEERNGTDKKMRLHVEDGYYEITSEISRSVGIQYYISYYNSNNEKKVFLKSEYNFNAVVSQIKVLEKLRSVLK